MKIGLVPGIFKSQDSLATQDKNAYKLFVTFRRKVVSSFVLMWISDSAVFIKIFTALAESLSTDPFATSNVNSCKV